ncbi:MAG: hypothetical protein FJ284_10055, partial [Planctomycetes bacterium]|nr:hypothetical protein [Planctomycetota bacterium]
KRRSSAVAARTGPPRGRGPRPPPPGLREPVDRGRDRGGHACRGRHRPRRDGHRRHGRHGCRSPAGQPDRG